MEKRRVELNKLYANYDILAGTFSNDNHNIEKNST